MVQSIPIPTQDYKVIIRCFTYNHEKYIEDALKGFVMQKTNFPFCAIVVDDFSTDKTAEIIKKYEEQYPDIIKGIYLKENYHSQKKKKAPLLKPWIERTNYIALCEGDDYWIDENKLQKQVEFLDNNLEYSLCFHRAIIQKEINIRTFLKCQDIQDRDYSPNEILKDWKIPTASLLVKKEYLEVDNKGKERILNGDIILILNCAKLGKLRGMKDEMSVYRMHKNGITYDKGKIAIRINKYPQHFEFIKDNYPFISPSIINKKIAKAYYRRGFLHRDIFDIFKSIKYYPIIVFEIIYEAFRKLYKKFRIKKIVLP